MYFIAFTVNLPTTSLFLKVISDACYRCQLRCSSLVQTSIETTSTQQLQDSVNEIRKHKTVAQLFAIPHLLPSPKDQYPSFLDGFPTEQATRIGLASLRAFALLLSLLAPSKATKTLHELQHALVRQQLSVMPRTEEK